MLLISDNAFVLVLALLLLTFLFVFLKETLRIFCSPFLCLFTFCSAVLSIRMVIGFIPIASDKHLNNLQLFTGWYVF